MKNSQNSITREEELFLLLSQAHQLVKKYANNIMSSCGVTLAEYNFLRIVGDAPQISPGDVRKRLAVTAPSVTQLVRNLEQKDLIMRTQNKTDSRAQHMQLTPTGEQLVHTVRDRIVTTGKEVFANGDVLSSLLPDLKSLIALLSFSPS